MIHVFFSTNNVTQDKAFLISLVDFERVSQFNWYLENCGRGHLRVVRSATKAERLAGYPQKIKLHRFILGLKRSNYGLVVDHIDGDTLDNRRENLRIVTHKNNMNNRKDNKGVSKWNNTQLT